MHASPATHPVPDAAIRTAARPGARRAVAVLAWAYVAFLGVQLFLAGLGVFVGGGWFMQHRLLAQRVGWVVVPLALLAQLGRLPAPVRRRAWLALLLFALQFVTVVLQYPLGTRVVSALHPVTGFLLSYVVLELARLATRGPETGPPAGSSLRPE